MPTISNLMPSRRNSLDNGGFTLIELITVVSIIAILATIAAPSFSTMIARTRVRAAATDLLFALTKARSEAIKRNASVTLSAKSGSWQNGWKIPDPKDSSNPDLDDHTALPAGVTVTTDADSVVYQSSGRIRGSIASFSISSSNANRCVTVDPSGRPYTKESAC